jgi:ribosomal protein L11 methyltransferase
MKEYIELEIIYDKRNYEHICNILYINGIKKLLDENGIIKIFFCVEEQNKILSLKQQLLALPSLSENSITTVKHESHNWYADWKKSIEPVLIEDKMIIYPSWKKKELKNKKGKILIEIDPKMSFGTGHTETTRLMLKMMFRLIDKNVHTMLDYGCGTGILSITGVKLGIRSAVAIDTDQDSISNAKEYIMKNKVNENIKLFKSDISGIKQKNFDLIAANIELKVIIKNLDHIYSKAKKRGIVLLSGILKDEEAEIRKALLKTKFKIMSTGSEAEWLCIHVLKE